GREHVVGRLAAVDVVVGMDRLLAARHAARELDARLAMTSLAFMFDWVPEPVWKTTSGNSSSHLPAITSSAARAMRSALSAGSWPSARLASADAFFTIPKARITRRPQLNRPRPIGKFSSER